MDQVLKDCMVDIAEANQAAGMDLVRGEDVADNLGRGYKVRPFEVAT